MTNETSAPPLNEVTRVSAERLVLDRKNPRLIELKGDATDVDIIAQLYRAEDLGELLQSMAANGYLDIEPLVVWEENGGLVVLEGNRRLAAIRLFRERDLVGRVFDRSRIKVTVPVISDQHRSTLDTVSVYRVASREEARSFIGFKHINGAAKWESYAKAKFAADWYREGETTLKEIADQIGDKHDTVKRMVSAIYVLEQAQDAEVFEVDDRVSPRFNFSHLYTALARAPYMRFLGLDASWATYDPSPAPVPKDKIQQLGEMLRWVYGSKQDAVEPVVQSQNPHIKQLGEILANADGLTALRTTGSLTDAYASIQPADQRFSAALFRARGEVREAANSLRGFDGKDTSLVDIAEDIRETAETIHDRMKKKVREAAVDGE